MDSALRPREIQARIRAGQSLEEVARLAGVPEERIEAYAAPVLAEREHVASMALAATVRRRGESGAHRNLRPVVRERLTSHQVDPDTVRWDAWRNEDRRWSVQARWTDDDEQAHTAVFFFDLRNRFSVAADDEARWLISEGTTDSATDESNELALVRALSATPGPVDFDSEPTISLPETRTAPAPGTDEHHTRPETTRRDRSHTGRGTSTESGRAGSGSTALGRMAGAATSGSPTTTGRSVDSRTGGSSSSGGRSEKSEEILPRSAATPQEIGEALEAEIDNYGLIPDGRSELDLLYDMLGGIAEDSINIYAGLADPVVPESIGLPQWDRPGETRSAAARTPERKAAESSTEASDMAPSAANQHRAAEQSAATTSAEFAGGDTTEPEQDRSPDPGQPPLTDDSETTVSIKPGAAKRRRKGRAQVPSWEEIMFGSPKTE